MSLSRDAIHGHLTQPFPVRVAFRLVGFAVTLAVLLLTLTGELPIVFGSWLGMICCGLLLMSANLPRTDE